TAFFTSAPILASSAAVNSFSAKAVGHMVPSSSFALSLKPKVAYLVLNFCALWKKQTTLPSLAYAGIPYQVVGERAGALDLMTAWSRLAMARSGSGISPIFASRSLSPSALRAATFCSSTRSFIAARSSSENPSYLFFFAVVLVADFCLAFIGGFLPVSLDGCDPHARVPGDAPASANLIDSPSAIHQATHSVQPEQGLTEAGRRQLFAVRNSGCRTDISTAVSGPYECCSI